MITAFDARRSEAKPTAKRTTVVLGPDGLVKAHIDPFDAAQGPAKLLLKLQNRSARLNKLRGASAHSSFHHTDHLLL